MDDAILVGSRRTHMPRRTTTPHATDARVTLPVTVRTFSQDALTLLLVPLARTTATLQFCAGFGIPTPPHTPTTGTALLLQRCAGLVYISLIVIASRTYRSLYFGWMLGLLLPYAAEQPSSFW